MKLSKQFCNEQQQRCNQLLQDGGNKYEVTAKQIVVENQ